MSDIPTVEIVNHAAPSGFTRINAADFDPATMQLRGAEWQDGAPGLTREEIAAMTKADVRDLLDAHGAEYDARSSVADLRAMLTRVVFVDA